MNQKESRRLSDYQRIVSYLYEYHHGIKGSNVGFAKIEKRQNQLRVYFHVKTNDQALEEMGLPASVRGEALTLEQFATLANILDR